MSHRIKKVESFIKEELSSIFLLKIQDPNIGLLTITSVKVTPDLKIARVYLSVFDKEKRAMVLEKVHEMKSRFRTELARRITLRSVPDLEFYIDDTLDYVEKMENLFKEIHKNDSKNEE
ncbi:ribosome-binding factor A [bacterium BRH_c32]|nr:MAG: ribosome-binding factor A [bacterium BRH_c32]